MGGWYTIGIVAGLGCAFGILVAGAVPRYVVAIAAAVVGGVVVGFLVWDWDEAVGGAVGAVCGAIGSGPLVRGALRRGGTRGGTALLLAVAALVGAALAFVPVVGYLEALAVPALGARLRSRAPERHAGLRSLARD